MDIKVTLCRFVRLDLWGASIDLEWGSAYTSSSICLASRVLEVSKELHRERQRKTCVGLLLASISASIAT